MWSILIPAFAKGKIRAQFYKFVINLNRTYFENVLKGYIKIFVYSLFHVIPSMWSIFIPAFAKGKIRARFY